MSTKQERSATTRRVWPEGGRTGGFRRRERERALRASGGGAG
jgi:hypothetical protein